MQIKDLGSLHGTYLNDDEDKIPSNESRELQDGDSIRFGVGVWRGSESFTPTTVKVGITFDHRWVNSRNILPTDSDNSYKERAR